MTKRELGSSCSEVDGTEDGYRVGDVCQEGKKVPNKCSLCSVQHLAIS